MSEGCSIADRAAPASQLVTSFSPLHRFARPSSQGGEDEERNEDEKRCYLWGGSPIYMAEVRYLESCQKREKSGQAWAMEWTMI